MEFALREEQRLFADSLRDFLTDRLPIETVRRLAETGSGFDATLWQGLCELGLPGLLVPERFGGAGLGILDAAVAAEVLGGAAAPAPFAGSVVMATLAFIHGATEAQQDEFLPRIAAGELRFGVAFAGTFVVGSTARYYYSVGRKPSGKVVAKLYDDALVEAKTFLKVRR